MVKGFFFVSFRTRSLFFSSFKQRGENQVFTVKVYRVLIVVKLNTFCFFSISIKYIVIVLMSAFKRRTTNETVDASFSIYCSPIVQFGIFCCIEKSKILNYSHKKNRS